MEFTNYFFAFRSDRLLCSVTFLSLGWCDFCEYLMRLARHAFDMLEILLVMWCKLTCPTFAKEIFSISEDSIWRKTVCVRCYVCMCVCIDICMLEFVVDKKLAWVVTLPWKRSLYRRHSRIGFLLEMSFKVLNWYVFAYMHVIDYTCFLLWLLVVCCRKTPHLPENTFILAQWAEWMTPYHWWVVICKGALR